MRPVPDDVEEVSGATQVPDAGQRGARHMLCVLELAGSMRRSIGIAG